MIFLDLVARRAEKSIQEVLPHCLVVSLMDTNTVQEVNKWTPCTDKIFFLRQYIKYFCWPGTK